MSDESRSPDLGDRISSGPKQQRLGRRSIEFIALAAAGLAAMLGMAEDQPVLTALGVATTAAVALGLMLHGPGLRIISHIAMLLAVMGMVVCFKVQGAGFVALAAFAVVIVATRQIYRNQPHWNQRRTASQGERDVWKQQDLGIDTTAEIPEADDSR